MKTTFVLRELHIIKKNQYPIVKIYDPLKKNKIPPIFIVIKILTTITMLVIENVKVQTNFVNALFDTILSKNVLEL